MNIATNAQSISLLVLLVVSALGIIGRYRNQKRKYIFPKHLNGYSYKKLYKTYEKPQMFSFAMYENSKGKKALAKSWRGDIKDFAYYTLKNELILYECISNYLAKNNPRIPKEYKNIGIPKLLSSQETKNELVLLVEFIEGKSAIQAPRPIQNKLYLRVVKYLHFIGEKLSRSDRVRIMRRSPFHIILLYPLLLIKSLITNPKAALPLVCGIPIYVLSIPFVFKDKKISLHHRDLHLENILTKGKKTYVIDLQFSLFSPIGYDIVTSLRICWNHLSLRVLLISILKQYYKDTISNRFLVRGQMIHCATHGLTNPDATESDLDFLSFALRTKNILSAD